MLKIYPAVTVSGVPGPYTDTTKSSTSHTLFPDTEDKDRYYALPEFPTFLSDGKGNPAFNLTWFYGSGQKSGGVCTFTVALPVPDLRVPGVRDAIIGAITNDLPTAQRAQNMFALCSAAAKADAVEVARLKKLVGLADDMDATKIAFDDKRDWRQFLPGADTLKVSPVPFSSGKVTITAFQDESAYANWIATNDAGKAKFKGTFEATPSLVNSNAAVVSFSLEDTGANLFWHALGGPEFDASGVTGYDRASGGVSIIAVRYTTEFDGQLPSASAVVTLSAKKIASVVKEKVTSRVWGRTYTYDKVVGKDYKDDLKQSIKLNLPIHDEAVEDMLQEWAAKQLDDMVRAQLPEVKLSDLNDNNLQKLDVLHDEKRTYELNKGITLTRSPQGQLPKINQLVKSDFGRFFNTINLNDVPYFNMDVTVNPPDQALLAKMSVSKFVVTQLTFDAQKLRDNNADPKPGAEVSTIEFGAVADRTQQTTQRKLLGTFDKRANGQGVIKYSYLVTYSDGTPSFNVDNITLEPKQAYLDLSAKELGVLAIAFNATDLPWGLLSSARLVVKYGDWEDSLLFTSTTLERTVAKPFGKKIDGKLQYQLTLNFTSGAPFVDEQKEAIPGPTAKVRLRNPISDAICKINFVLASDVTKAQLRVKYTMPLPKGDPRPFETMLVLQKPGALETSWSVPQVPGGSFVVTKAKVDGKDLKGTEQIVESDQYEVTISKDSIDTF